MEQVLNNQELRYMSLASDYENSKKIFVEQINWKCLGIAFYAWTMPSLLGVTGNTIAVFHVKPKVK